MLEAAFWGLVGASSLLVGALIAFRFAIGERALGRIMAFGAGVLISAVAYELVEEAVAVAATGYSVAAGFAAGAFVFYLGDLAIERRLGAGGGAESGAAIVLGAVLDGIPESVVIGISLLSGEGVGVAVVVAVFLSNVPEAISATADLVAQGRRRSSLLLMWGEVVAAGTLASAAGYGLLGDASGEWIAAMQAFAAGAILVMLADSMMPQAYSEGGTPAGLFTALGFAVAALLSFKT